MFKDNIFHFGVFTLKNPTVNELVNLKDDFENMFSDLESDYMTPSDKKEAIEIFRTIEDIEKAIANS